jgi:CO/xanthine dehydrogenase FAD-binding subunit
VRLVSQDGERSLPLSEFVTGPGQTARRPGELLKSVWIPCPPAGAGTAFEKLGKRRALIISIVNAAALLVLREGRIGEARLALGAVAPTVVRCTAAEEWLLGKAPDPELLKQAAQRVLEAIRPIGDVRASAGYRRSAAVGLARRALLRASEGCRP